MLSKSLTIFLLIIFPVVTTANDSQAVDVDLKSLKEKLEYEFKALDNQKGEVDFEKVLTDLGKKTKHYIHFRKLECQGEYSTIEIDENGSNVSKKKKLSKIETKLCMLELINFQRQFNNIIFDLRKKMLVVQQKKQLEILEKYHQENIEELEKMAAGYR